MDKLNLQGFQVTDETIGDTLKESKGLTYILLYDTKITDEGLKTILIGSPNLYDLCIAGCDQITDKGIAYIKQYRPNLEKLRLKWSEQITNECIKGLPQLTDLALDKCPQITDEALGDLPKSIVNLSLHRSNFTVEGIKRLSLYPKLDLLNIFDCPGIDDQTLDSLPSSITRLWLNSCENMTGENTGHFNPSLTQLQLKGSNFTEQGIQNLLGKCPHLRYLEVDSRNITDQMVSAISKLSELVLLELHQLSNITEQSISAISKLSNLKSLYLYDLPDGIFSEALAPLLDLKHLEFLHLLGGTFVGEHNRHEEVVRYLKELIASSKRAK